jgi:DUF1365 family protein
MAWVLHPGELGAITGAGMSRSVSSALYEGTVRHTRLSPFHHTFSYRVFYGLFDIDRLDQLDRDLRWFSVGRFNLLSFDPGVHGPADGGPLRPWVESVLHDAGIELEGGAIHLLAFPRILGYVFNPISVWYCHDRSDQLVAVIYEVRNTFGDRHCYVVPVKEDSLRHDFDKRLHVSPFNGMEQEYRFSLSPPGSRISISIDLHDEEGRLLRAGMALSRIPFTDANVWRLFWTHPLLTMKVITAIHWQALKLKLKGATFYPRPQPAEDAITIVRRQEVRV